jgi:hypothetical protein
MLKTASRIATLFLIAVVMSLSLSQSGRTASTCLVERGIDPLDILNQSQSIRHNVWIALDTSGSMKACFAPWDTSSSPCGSAPSTPTRIAGARDVIIDLFDSLVDSNGDPLVNWGFTYFDNDFDARSGVKEPDPNYIDPFVLEWKCPTGALSGRPEGDPQHDVVGEPTGIFDIEDNYPENPAWCVGMNANYFEPPLCSEPDPRQDIKDELNGLLDADGMLIDNSSATPVGVMLDELSEAVVNYTGANPLLPGQKNYIILMTDGEDTCECYNYLYDNPAANTFDGALRIRGDSASSAPSHPISSTVDYTPMTRNLGNTHERDISAYNAGLKGREAFDRVYDSDQDGVGGDGDIFVVGLGLDSARLRLTNHVAWESSGVVYGLPGRPAYDVSDPSELADALEDILQQLPIPPVTVSAGASVVGSVKEVIASHTNTTHGLTAADFIASGIGDTEVRKERAIHRNNVLFTTSFDLPGFRGHLKAYNIYNVQSDESRTSDFTEIWDAGEELQTRDLTTHPRNIYFNRSDGTGGQLNTDPNSTTTTLSATDLGVTAGFLSEYDPKGVGAKTAADAAKLVEMVIQGWRPVGDATNGFYKSSDPTKLNFTQVEDDGVTRTWKLLDATNASPAVALSPPRSPDADPPDPTLEYRDFYEDYINRMTVVYLGTNDGMMHAFRGDNGHEIFGYIPHDVLPDLKSLTETLVSGNNGIVGHQYFIAASATVEDAYLQDSPSGVPEWRTVLAFGRGAGGKYVTALDVSDVGDWDGASPAKALPDGFLAPQLLFTVGNRDGFSDPDGSGIPGHDYDGFGETWSLPAMGRVHNGTDEGQWVVFMGTGYGCVGTTEGRYLYVLKLEDGTVYKKLGPIDDIPGAAIDQNGTPATPTLFNPHESGVNDGRDFVTRVYIGDLQGVIHKLDATADDPDDWEFGVFFEVTSEADDGPGEGNHDQPITVQIKALKLVGSDTIYLFVGTGGDNRVDLTAPDSFKMVGIEDTDSASTVPASDPGFPGELLVLDNGTDKFFFDLLEDERMTTEPVLARNSSTNGVVFFATTRTETDPDTCAATFFSTLFAAGVTTGLGSFDLDPSTAGVQDQMDLGEGKVTSLYHRDEHLYVSKSGGIDTDAGTDVLGSDEFPAPVIAAGTIQVLVDGFRMSPF